MTVLDPTAKPTFSIYSTNHSAVKVRLYAVEPQDWRQFQDYVRHMNYDDGKRPAIPGRLVYDEVVAIASKPDEMVETRIDVAKALNGGYGNVIVDIEPTVKKDKYDRTRIFTWLRRRRSGLTHLSIIPSLSGLRPRLKTGKPIAGVESFDLSERQSRQRRHRRQKMSPDMIQRAWNWLTSWGSSQADEIQSIDTDGTASCDRNHCRSSDEPHRRQWHSASSVAGFAFGQAAEYADRETR